MFLLLFFFSFFFTTFSELTAAQYPRLLRRNAIIISPSSSEGIVPRENITRRSTGQRRVPKSFEEKFLEELLNNRNLRAQEAQNLPEQIVPSISQ